MSKPIRAVFTNENFAAAFRYVKSLCEDPRNGIRNLVLLVPMKANAQSSTTLGSCLGDSVCKVLGKGKAVSIADIPMHLETKKTLSHLSVDTLVICAYASKDLMDKIDAAGPVAGVVALPYSGGAVEQWIKSWSPLIDGAAPAQVQALIDDPVVQQAMQGLTDGINLAHSILNTRDKEHANRTLRILRRKKHGFDPQALRAWAVGKSWKPSAADELYALATKILQLKAVPKVDRPDAADHTYSYWVEEAEKR